MLKVSKINNHCFGYIFQILMQTKDLVQNVSKNK